MSVIYPVMLGNRSVTHSKTVPLFLNHIHIRKQAAFLLLNLSQIVELSVITAAPTVLMWICLHAPSLYNSTQQAVKNNTQTMLVQLSVGWNVRPRQCAVAAISAFVKRALKWKQMFGVQTVLYTRFSAYFHKSNKWTVTRRAWLFVALPSEVAAVLFDKPAGMWS